MRTVTVTGHGSAREVPDTVVVRVAATHRAGGVADALAGADSAAREIIAVGREHTDASRIASTSLNVWPVHDSQGRPDGFEARHALSLTCPDVQAAGALLGDLAARVGDRLVVEGLGLEVGDVGRALDQARAGAYADAVARGRHLAELAGARLGEVQAMAEGSGVGGWRPQEGMAMDAKAMTIAPGETTITAALTTTFALL